MAEVLKSLEAERLQLESVGFRSVEYSLGHSRADKTTIYLGHNDVLVLAARLLGEEKFRRILANRFPVVFIDEYQDTDNVVFDALKAHVIGRDGSPLIGFFGDHWQKIYGSGGGRIEHPQLKPIGKKANFRSVHTVVDCLNRMRPELPQEVEDPTAPGSVVVFHTNEWKGERQSGAQWKGDLPEAVAHTYLQFVIKCLSEVEWRFDPGTTKILMLTHNVLAAEQGYRQIAAVFPRTELFIKKEDPHIAFLLDTVEPVCVAFTKRRYGEMFSALGAKSPVIGSHSDKAAWFEHLTSLAKIRGGEPIGAVLDLIRKGHLFPIPEAVERKERTLEKLGTAPAADEAVEMTRLRQLRTVPYTQIVALKQFIEERTPFSTKHGVKGLEFENVLVVLGRGWNLYNFGQFLEWSGAAGVPPGRADTYERNRNLFYVACSRPKKRLALLFTQELSPDALTTLAKWFGEATIRSLPSL